MQSIKVIRKGEMLIIGEQPELIVNLSNQKNFIKSGEILFPYTKKVLLSEDLLMQKRKNVFETAIAYYYRQACAVADGMKKARAYRANANTTVREIERK